MTANARRILIVVLVAAVVAIVIAVVVLSNDDDEVETTPTSGATTEPETSTTAGETTSSTVPRTITDQEAGSVVWPDPDGDIRYDDPLVAVAGFAEDLVGFTDPVYGEYQAGDSRSGEVEIRAIADGAVTTTFVRQLSDDTWWILGTATANIDLTDPIAGQAIDDPLLLTGQARAFEGTVQVAVYQRGVDEPLGEGFVTGSGGPDLGPFSGEVRWTNPGGGWGVVLLYTTSAEDGRVWEALAVPVGFIGGD